MKPFFPLFVWVDPQQMTEMETCPADKKINPAIVKEENMGFGLGYFFLKKRRRGNNRY